jgi:hypothetical protein
VVCLVGIVVLILRRDPTHVETTDEIVEDELDKHGGE